MDQHTVPDIWRLNRFTTLPVLLDVLKRRSLALLDPATWEDKNDSGILLEYKRRKKAARVLALCFTYGDETIHHWKAYSDGISGCCIEFDARRLRRAFDKLHLRHGPVRYRKLSEVSKHGIVLGEIPFTKRWPYRCEEEYRVICEDSEEGASFDVPIDLKMIRKITISQRMPAPVHETIKEYLRAACSDPAKMVNRSTLFENKVWLEKFSGA